MAIKHDKDNQLDRRDLFRKHLRFDRQSAIQLRDRNHQRWTKLQLSEDAPELEKKHPGFAFALQHKNESAEIQQLHREHIKLLVDDYPEISNFFDLVDVCFFSARSGARILITETDEPSFIEFSAGVAIPAEKFGVDLAQVDRAIAVDGHIESVSEIDRLLTVALDAKASLILCRSISKEIELTVKKNLDRMKLAILTFKITDETVNDLGDVCAALDLQLHDSVSITGLSWQHKQFQDVSRFESSVVLNRIIVNKPSTHIEMRKKIAASKARDASVSHASEIFERRLVNLGGVVRINITTSLTSALCVDALTRAMLILDDAARHGVVLLSDRAVGAGAYAAAFGFGAAFLESV